VDAREGEMETPNYELRDNRASGNAKKLTRIVFTALVGILTKMMFFTNA
jgi:LPS-assembly protein